LGILAETLRVKYNLLPAEINQLISSPPKTRMELTLIVEEGEERFDEEVLDEMLSVLGRSIETCAVGVK
jgi:DNA-directed RNA polymerase subunit F